MPTDIAVSVGRRCPRKLAVWPARVQLHCADIRPATPSSLRLLAAWRHAQGRHYAQVGRRGNSAITPQPWEAPARPCCLHHGLQCHPTRGQGWCSIPRARCKALCDNHPGVSLSWLDVPAQDPQGHREGLEDGGNGCVEWREGFHETAHEPRTFECIGRAQASKGRRCRGAGTCAARSYPRVVMFAVPLQLVASHPGPQTVAVW